MRKIRILELVGTENIYDRKSRQVQNAIRFKTDIYQFYVILNLYILRQTKPRNSLIETEF